MPKKRLAPHLRRRLKRLGGPTAPPRANHPVVAPSPAPAVDEWVRLAHLGDVFGMAERAVLKTVDRLGLEVVDRDGPDPRVRRESWEDRKHRIWLPPSRPAPRPLN